ncbi:putative nuclease HARBI1 [Tanacetum coccineum]
MYDEKRFRQTFRMARPLFNQIVNAVTNHSAYFQSNPDCAGREGHFTVDKEHLWQIVNWHNELNASFLAEYKQITVASQDLWIWHAFFGVTGSNNDINVLYQSPIFNDLVDGIYPELAPLVKTISEPADDDHKRILYKQKQESTRKDVERAFGVLKKKWAILANLLGAYGGLGF